MQQAHLQSFKIVHFATGKFLRGGERQVLWLHRGLLARGHKSVLVCRETGALAGLDLPHCKAITWKSEIDPSSFSALLKTVRRLKMELADSAPDEQANPIIIHCHDAHALSHGALVSKLAHLPLIGARRVLMPIRNGSFSRWKYRACGRLLAVSSVVAGQCGAAVEPVRIDVVHDGVEWNIPVLTRENARRNLGLPVGLVIIGTVGYFTIEKNVGLISRLAEQIAGSHPQARILCIGPVDPETRALFAKSNNIIASGFRNDAVMHYAAFDLYISTSRFEGLGTALLDALVRDIPVVATDAGGTRDLFEVGGALIGPDDPAGFAAAVKSKLDNLGVAQTDAKKTGEFARRNFSVDSMVENTIGSYAKLLQT